MSARGARRQGYGRMNGTFRNFIESPGNDELLSTKPGNYVGTPSAMLREPVINLSFRRMPESIALNSLDPGMRRDDAKRISQKFLRYVGNGSDDTVTSRCPTVSLICLESSTSIISSASRHLQRAHCSMSMGKLLMK